MRMIMTAILFFVIPAGVLAFFGVSLYRYLLARRQSAREPGAISPEQLRVRRLLLILSGLLAGGLVAVVAGLMALMLLAIAFM